jgi:hypothetical protein
MNKKAQGLPISTIALIIMVIVVLAALTIFFFSYYGKSKSGTDLFTCQQICQSAKAIYPIASTAASCTSTCPGKSATDFCANKCYNSLKCSMGDPCGSYYVSCNTTLNTCINVTT